MNEVSPQWHPDRYLDLNLLDPNVYRILKETAMRSNISIEQAALYCLDLGINIDTAIYNKKTRH
jgi:hypothetical protein